MPYQIGHSTKASSTITSSSGATITIPALASAFIEIQKITINTGPSLVALNDNVTISNIATVGTINVPFAQVLANASYFEEDFATYNAPIQSASQGTAVVITVPAELGGADVFVKVDYYYF